MAKQKRVVSGPGAADFFAAEGGVDRPASEAKGTGVTRGEPLVNADDTLPRPGPDTEATPGDRHPRTDERSGSQTGTIGGGGPEAHNPSPIRAVEDE